MSNKIIDFQLFQQFHEFGQPFTRFKIKNELGTKLGVEVVYF